MCKGIDKNHKARVLPSRDQVKRVIEAVPSGRFGISSIGIILSFLEGPALHTILAARPKCSYVRGFEYRLSILSSFDQFYVRLPNKHSLAVYLCPLPFICLQSC